MKHPILIGLLNALVPGLGYVIIRERLVFGIMMLVGSLAITLAILLDTGSWGSTFMTEGVIAQALETLSYGLITAAFAYDGYRLAKRKHEAAPEETISESADSSEE